MLTIEDCIEMAGLTPEEVDAIAEHEHLPTMIAIELGWYLEQTHAGEERIRQMIVDDMTRAEERGDRAHAAKLKLVLQQFLAHHGGTA